MPENNANLFIALVAIIGFALIATYVHMKYFVRRHTQQREHSDRIESGHESSNRVYQIRLSPLGNLADMTIDDRSLIITENNSRLLEIPINSIERIVYDKRTILVVKSDGSNQLLYHLHPDVRTIKRVAEWENNRTRSYNFEEALDLFKQQLTTLGIEHEFGDTGAPRLPTILGYLTLAIVVIAAATMIVLNFTNL